MQMGGGGTTPIYFSNGKPVACSYSLNKTVPSDAKFTDTTYTADGGYVSASSSLIAAGNILKKEGDIFCLKNELDNINHINYSFRSEGANADKTLNIWGKITMQANTIMLSNASIDTTWWADVNLKRGGIELRTIHRQPYIENGDKTNARISSYSYVNDDENDVSVTYYYETNDPYSQTQLGFVNKNGLHFKNIHYDNLNNTSDIRIKDIKENYELSLEELVNAPLFKFIYKEHDNYIPDNNIHVGTSANYWNDILPEITTQFDGKYYGMDYAKLGAVGVISLARIIKQQQEEIDILKSELKELKELNKN